MGSFIDISGKRFGRLVVLHRVGTKRGQADWTCQCDCGKKRTIVSLHLRDGRATSCGCLHRERLVESAKTHGMSNTGEYKIWKGMIRRCTDKKCKTYPDYGGRGITVDKRWMSMSAFYEDMGRRQPGMTIGRKNNDLGYSKDNCRWETSKQQSRNTRRTVRITAFGETKSASDWAEDNRCKCPYTALVQRIRAGWEHQDAISTPIVPPHVRTFGHRRAS
jgi:hypothetical protein